MPLLFTLITILTFKFLQKLFYKDYKLYSQISPKNAFYFIFFLKKFSIFQFKNLVDFTLSDCPEKKKRFLAHYLFSSLSYSNKVRVAFRTNETNKLMSIINLFKNANWAEREVWDMFGVIFYKHKDLRRLLTDYGFSGFPLRKDFPLTGFIEVSYNNSQKRLIYERVVLSQEYRNFWFDHYTSYWGFQKFRKINNLILKVRIFRIKIWICKQYNYYSNVWKNQSGKNLTYLFTFKQLELTSKLNKKINKVFKPSHVQFFIKVKWLKPEYFFFNLWKGILANTLSSF